MDLIITRPALDNALKEMNFDLEKPTRQQMRSLVCAKCHMEYYFKGEGQSVHLSLQPWVAGRRRRRALRCVRV